MMPELKITIPLDWNLSKNRRTTRRQGRTVGNRTHYAILQSIADEIAMLSKAKRLKWQHKSTSLKIEVFKKTQRGDGINLIDGIADAVCKRKNKNGNIISTGIGIDDCWLDDVRCIQKIDKLRPRVEITVWQEG